MTNFFFYSFNVFSKTEGMGEKDRPARAVLTMFEPAQRDCVF